MASRERASNPGDAPELVFVYGELRRGASEGSRTSGSDFVGRGEVAGELYLVSDSPGLLLTQGKRRVVGDVIRMTAEQIRVLDESADSGFLRTKTKVILRDHNYEEVPAWTYEWQGSLEGRPQIPSGDWMLHTLGESAPWFTFIALFQLLGVIVVVGMSVIDFEGFLPEFARSRIGCAFLVISMLICLAFSIAGNKRNEPMGWLRAGMSVVSFVLLVFYVSGMVNFGP